MIYIDRFFHRSLIIAIAFLIALPIIVNASSPRNALIEEGTNSSCGPCAARNPIFNAYLNGIDETKIIPVTLHSSWPGPNDPMYLFDKTISANRIVAYYGINGVPTAAANGVIYTKTAAGGWNGDPGDTVAMKTEIAKTYGKSSPYTISIVQTNNGTKVSADVTVQSDVDVSTKKLRIYVCEYDYYNPNAGSNGETHFEHVARHMIPSTAGTSLNIVAGGNQTVSGSCDIGTYNIGQMYIVAFIQDDGTKEVLQAATNLNLGAKATCALASARIDPSTKKVINTTVQNTGDCTIDVNLSIDPNSTSKITGWSAKVTPDVVTGLAPGDTKDIQVEVTSGTGNALYIVGLQANPVPQTGIALGTVSNVLALSSGTKYVFYTSTSNADAPLYNSINALSQFSNQFVIMPTADVIFTSFPPKDFDIVTMTVDYWHRGAFISAAVAQGLNDAYMAGKKVLISSDIDLNIQSQSKYQNTGNTALFGNMGISLNKSVMRVSVDQSTGAITGTLPYTSTGVQSDPIGDGLTLSYNDNLTTPYTIYTDLIKLNSGTTAVPFLYYDGNGTDIAAIHNTSKAGGKVVYLSSGFESIDDQSLRDDLVKKIFNWLNTAATTSNIQLNKTALAYGNVMYGQSKDITFEISNTGTKLMTIMNISFVSGNDGAFSITEKPTFPVSLDAGAKKTYTVNFKPVANQSKAYNIKLRVNSDADNSKVNELTVTANATTSSVEDPTSIAGFGIQAGPNPFNSKTTVTYRMDNENYLNLSVIDATGQKVAQLINGFMNTGIHEVSFSADNLASGTYFIVATSNGKTTQLPVVVAK
ncbi:MAG: Omp28-related outer membrane protein [Candidatus Kapabacteria bacterium]|nr:Omp28-related outer membrane protein [Candidatus Kapabacteria bacterium]